MEAGDFSRIIQETHMGTNTKSSLPKKINIFSKTYTIKYIKKLEDVDPANNKDSIKNRTVDSQAIFGTVDFSTNEIRVYKGKDYPIQSVIQILLHELSHCIEKELTIDFRKDDLEKIIDNFALGFYSILVENDFNMHKLLN
jgi:hypothetical protein